MAMSLVNPQSPELTSLNLDTLPAPSAKKKNNKKKKNANKPKPVDTDGANNGGDGPENDDLTDEPVTPVVVCALSFCPRHTGAGPYSSECAFSCYPGLPFSRNGPRLLTPGAERVDRR